MSIISIINIIIGIDSLFGAFLHKKLNNKTRYCADDNLSIIMFLLHFYLWFIVSLNIKYFKHRRKITYFRRRCNEFNHICSIFGDDILSEDEIKERRNIEMFLKLRKIKKRSLWSY